MNFRPVKKKKNLRPQKMKHKKKSGQDGAEAFCPAFVL